MALNLGITPEESIIVGGLQIKAIKKGDGVVLSIIAIQPFLMCEGETIRIGLETQESDMVRVSIEMSSPLPIQQKFCP